MKPNLFRKLAALYRDMDASYEQAAAEIGLTCQGCADNCCVSFFQHHTHVEWAYLWKGLSELDEERVHTFTARAEDWLRDARLAVAAGGRPRIMCPLNEDGLCAVYSHRLMICRMHGVPNRMVRPDGREVAFPGCDRAQKLVEELKEQGVEPQGVDRTGFYRRLAALEMDMAGKRKGGMVRVDMTLAEMLVAGPPRI